MSVYVFKIISLLGGLALFLFGMDIMGKALERSAGGRLQTILAKVSSSLPRGFLLGIAVTAVIQSSSATSVMVVGFVNSGILTLRQAVGVIIGSNVGTTVTAWILSLSGLEGDHFLISLFKPATFAPLLGTLGIGLFLFSKREQQKSIGTILLGFLTLMTGISSMSESMRFLETEPWFAQMMLSFSNPLAGIAVGALLTAVLQSSSASIGILQSLCVTGAVPFASAIPIILGQNIGTCVTALIGSIGTNRNARRTAMVHLLFNVIGVILFILLFYGLGLLVPFPFLSEPAQAWNIAVIHTCFNLAATAVLLPMSDLLVKLACILVPDVAEPEQDALLDERLLATPSVAIDRAREVSGRMAADAAQAFSLAIGLTKQYDPAVMAQVNALEAQTDVYQDALGSYLVKLTGRRLSMADNRTLNILLYTISDLERIADHAVTVALAGQEMAHKGIRFSPQAQKELSVLEQAVLDVIHHTVRAYQAFDLEAAMKVEPREQVIDALVKETKSRHVQRLRDGTCSVEYGFVLEDLLTACQRSADHCSNVAVEMLQVAEGKLEAHEYLNALKAGELEESAQFSRRFQKYRAQYTFPGEDSAP